MRRSKVLALATVPTPAIRSPLPNLDTRAICETFPISLTPANNEALPTVPARAKERAFPIHDPPARISTLSRIRARATT